MESSSLQKLTIEINGPHVSFAFFLSAHFSQLEKVELLKLRPLARLENGYFGEKCGTTIKHCVEYC